MRDMHFIAETSNRDKFRSVVGGLSILFIILVISILCSTIWFAAIKNLPMVQYMVAFIYQDIAKLTLKGLFLSHFIGGLFFVPSPDEIIFYTGLVQGNNIFLALITAVGGYFLAQVLNYYMGIKLSGTVTHLVSKRKLYKVRRFNNKYGAFGIFVFNALPSPAPLLTLALGIAKYNKTRLFFWTFLGKLTKYIVVILLFLLIQ